MKHFPVYMNLVGRVVVVSGAGETAVPKIRLLHKTEAMIAVYGKDPCDQVKNWAAARRITLHGRRVVASDIAKAALLYAANDDDEEDARVAKIGRSTRVPFNIVDNLEDSAFITPAIVDRDPVTIAIGTEGAAPVLARKLKARIEEQLPQSVGLLARLGKSMRPLAGRLPAGLPRRRFWAAFYSVSSLQTLARHGEIGVRAWVRQLMEEQGRDGAVGQNGRVSYVGTGPGDPDLMTLKARKVLHDADVVVHDRLVPVPILELARREAIIINAGKTGFGHSCRQDEINAIVAHHAGNGLHVVRLKSGDPSIFARLDEEIAFISRRAIAWDVVPGITAASASAARLGVSLTRRLRNSEVRLVTAHDVNGFAEQDWNALARQGTIAAIYMARTAATFIRGRLLMHGASASTPVTILENVSRPDEKVVRTTLFDLPKAITGHNISDATILLLGVPTARVMSAQTPSGAGTGVLPRAAGAGDC